METLRISVSESTKAFLDAQVSEGRCRSVDEFVSQLVHDEEKRRAKENVETLLAAGLQSEASELRREDWDELKRRVWERHNKRNGS